MTESFAAKFIFNTVDGPIGCVGILGAPFWPTTEESLWALILDGVIASRNRLEKHFRATRLVMFVRIVPSLAGLEEHSRATHEEMFIVIITSCLASRKSSGVISGGNWDER